MTTTLAPEAPVEAPAPRWLETEIEPRNIPPELLADSLVALVHNSVLRNPDKEALRWKLPKTKRQAEGPPEEEAVAWTSTSYRQTWDWITQVAMGLVDIVIETGLQPYDIQALIPLIENAGGVVSDWEGGRCDAGGDVLACGDHALHAELLRRIARR